MSPTTPESSNAPPLDLSGFDVPSLCNWLFARPIAADDKSPYLDEEFIVSSPAKLLESLTSLFQNFTPIAATFTPGQIEQGLWGIFGGAGIQAQDHLLTEKVSLPTRIHFIDSMYAVFRDVASRVEWDGTAYYMWFDLVCKGFWFNVEHDPSLLKPSETEEAAREWLTRLEDLLKPKLDAGAAPQDPRDQARRADTFRAERAHQHLARTLTSEQQTIQNALLEVLTNILSLPHLPSQGAALHGLGHLHHPAVRDIVQKYIDHHSADWPAESRAYLENCRDGAVL